MKPIIKAIIVDDESGQFDALKGRLKLENITDIVIVATAETIKEAVEAILFHQPQLVFLDIDMSGNNESGFDLFTELEKLNFKINFKVVFVTGNAKPHYALEAFKHNALGYLVKGADLGKRLVQVVDECREQIKLQRFFLTQQQQIQSIMHCKCRTIYDEKMVINLKIKQLDSDEKDLILKTTGGKIFVNRSEILYIESERVNLNIYTVHNKTPFVVLSSLISFEKEILRCPKYFLRISNSYIVNMKKVLGINERDERVIIENGKKIPIGKEGKDRLRQYLDYPDNCLMCN